MVGAAFGSRALTAECARLIGPIRPTTVDKNIENRDYDTTERTTPRGATFITKGSQHKDDSKRGVDSTRPTSERFLSNLNLLFYFVLIVVILLLCCYSVKA